MDLLKAGSRRSTISEILYVAFNLLLAVIVFGLTVWFSSPIPAAVVILLSKWRVFAVRPRFWFANIQTNLVDVMLGVGVAILIWQATGSLVIQIILTILYAAWLIGLKPRSKRSAMLSQAGIAQAVIVSALFSIAYFLPAFIVVALMWLIGYATARHVISTYEEDQLTLLSLIWGFFFAELGWLAYHWTIAYEIVPSTLDFQIPQVAVFGLALSYIAYRVYDIRFHKEKFRLKDLGWPFVFVIGLVLMLLVFFTGLSSGEL